MWEMAYDWRFRGRLEADVHSCEGSENSFCPHFQAHLVFWAGLHSNLLRPPARWRTPGTPSHPRPWRPSCSSVGGEEVQVSRNAPLTGKTQKRSRPRPLLRASWIKRGGEEEPPIDHTFDSCLWGGVLAPCVCSLMDICNAYWQPPDICGWMVGRWGGWMDDCWVMMRWMDDEMDGWWEMRWWMDGWVIPSWMGRWRRLEWDQVQWTVL